MSQDLSAVGKTIDLVSAFLFELGYRHAPSYSFCTLVDGICIEMHFKLKEKDPYAKIVILDRLKDSLSEEIGVFKTLELHPQSTRHLRVDVILGSLEVEEKAK
jgi:hypothetical protein